MPNSSIVLCTHLEIALRVAAHRAYLGSLLAYHDMAAICALPYCIAVLREHFLVAQVLQQLAIALLVLLLYGCNAFKLLGNLYESLFAGFLCHA